MLDYGEGCAPLVPLDSSPQAHPAEGRCHSFAFSPIGVGGSPYYSMGTLLFDSEGEGCMQRFSGKNFSLVFFFIHRPYN